MEFMIRVFLFVWWEGSGGLVKWFFSYWGSGCGGSLFRVWRELVLCGLRFSYKFIGYYIVFVCLVI